MKSDSKTDFYSYKNIKMYSTCKVCFNKKVRCELCNKELNRSYLRTHIKKQHLQHIQHKIQEHMQHHYNQHQNCNQQHNYNQQHTYNQQHNYQPRMQWHSYQPRMQRHKYQPRMQWHNGSGSDIGVYNAPCFAPSNAVSGAACVGVSEGLSGVACNSENNAGSENNRTSKVGPSFCGKTHLLLNKLRLIRLEDPARQIRIITMSPEQNEFIEVGDALRDVSVEENVGDLEEYRWCFVVFADMFDSNNQKLIDQFYTRGRHKFCDGYYLSQSYFNVPKKTIRNNSNLIIFFNKP